MADAKLTALTALTTAADADIFYVVDDPGGSPISKKITKANLFTDTTLAGSADWSGGNVIYVPLSGSIQAYHDAATAGDTIQLGAGTYTITSTLTVNKKLHIKGMGRGITTINNAVTLSNTPMFDITTEDGTVFSDFSATKSGAGGSDYLFQYSVNCSAYDIDFVDTSTGSAYPGFVTSNGAKTFNAYRCHYTGSGSHSAHLFANISSAGASANFYNCHGVTADGTNASFGNILLWSNNSTATINVYGGSYSTATNIAAAPIYCSNGALNVYEGAAISGSGASAFDVKQTGGTLTLYAGTNLVNNKTSGTITYGGTVVSGTVRGIHKTQDDTAAVSDGNYTVGKGTATDGVITIKDGLITAITEATDA